MRNTLLLSSLFTMLGAFAQPANVKIIDPSVLNSLKPVSKNKGAEAALTTAGITAEQQELVMKYGDGGHWPEGISTAAARKVNEPYIQNYACFRVAAFKDDTTAMTVIMVPAKENIHMPEDMRPLADFYLAVPERAIVDVNTGRPRPEISRGPKWKNLPEAKILQPDQLYATYEMGPDSLAQVAMQKRGMSQAEIDAVIFRSTETNWPDGINSFDKRQKFLAEFKKYKTYLGAKWEDKVLLIIPVEKNKKRPILMRPYVDLYFVYNASAVEVKKK